jgi:AcrR family transcriptional regulator
MTKPRRADSARNQASILRAARTLIASKGPSAGMDEIAREAGVAVGTLYRHFPTKVDLVNAILTDRLEALVVALEQALTRVEGGAGALTELLALLDQVAAGVGEDRALKAAATNLTSDTMRDLERRAMTALTHMVEVGHREGALRPDVTAADVALLVETMPGDELPEAARRRWLELMVRGLT